MEKTRNLCNTICVLTISLLLVISTVNGNSFGEELHSGNEKNLLTSDVRLGWRVIRDIVSETPDNVYVEIVGEQLPFVRNPPKAVDDKIVGDFFESFNLLQDVDVGPSEYYPCQKSEEDINGATSCPLYVASIPKATITGIGSCCIVSM